MALTLNSFFGCETGTLTAGTEQLFTVQNTVSADSSIKRSGNYSAKLTGAVAQGSILIYRGNNGTTDAGNNYIYGFAVRFSSVTPVTAFDFLGVVKPTGGASTDLRLKLNTNGDLLIMNSANVNVGTVAAPFVANTWYFIELYHVRSASGSVDVFIDGIFKTSASSSFMGNTSNINLDYFQFQSGLAVGVDVYIDDFYTMSGATSTSQLLGVNAHVSAAYQKTNGAATEIGSALSSGTWANSSETPGSESNFSTYAAGRAGGMMCNSGTRVGAFGDINLSNVMIKGMLGTFRAKRSSGSASTHRIRMGNNMDGMTDLTVTLSTSFANYYFLSESATIVPNITESIQLGYSVTGGAQTMTLSDAWVMLLYVKSNGNFFQFFYI